MEVCGHLVGFLLQERHILLFQWKMVSLIVGAFCGWFVYFLILWNLFCVCWILNFLLVPSLILRNMAPSGDPALPQKQYIWQTALSFPGPYLVPHSLDFLVASVDPTGSNPIYTLCFFTQGGTDFQGMILYVFCSLSILLLIPVWTLVLTPQV